jgi:hypothetical protein
MAGTCLLAMWCPVYGWRDSNPGSDTELGNSSCDAKGKLYKWNSRRGKVPMHMKGADHPVLDIMYGPAAPQGTRIKLEVGYTAAQSRH